MKRVLPFLPLVCLSPVGYFLASYLDGAGILPRGSGILIGAVCMFILPWIVSAAFAALARTTVAVRIALLISTFGAQLALLFTFAPPAATSEMIGIAHRLGHELPIHELRESAELFRQKFRDGTLNVSPRNKHDYFTVDQDAVVVSDSELPESLKGRFQRVFIQSSGTRELQVVFALGSKTGIICDSRTHVREFFVCSVADGVQAYRYQRL